MDNDTHCPTCDQTLLPPDVKTHLLLCASFTPQPPKPSSPPNHILGLHFPSTPKSHPVPVWIPLTSSTDDETSITFQSVDVSAIFPSTSSTSTSPIPSYPDVLYTERNTVRNRDTASMLEFWTTDEKQGLNSSIASLGGTHHPWTGPVLALAMTRATGFMVDPGSYRDVTLADAGDVVDFLVDYENPVHGERVREVLGMLGGESAKSEDKAVGRDGEKEGLERENDVDGDEISDEDGVKIRCTCGVTKDDGSNVIHCDGCDTWQHMECYYPGKGKSMRFDHRCAECKTGEAGAEAKGKEKAEREPVVFEVM